MTFRLQCIRAASKKRTISKRARSSCKCSFKTPIKIDVISSVIHADFTLLMYTFHGRRSRRRLYCGIVIVCSFTNRSCGKSFWILALLQINAAWVKQVRLVPREAHWIGSSSPALKCITFPTWLPWNAATDVSSMFINNNCFPVFWKVVRRAWYHCQTAFA